MTRFTNMTCFPDPRRIVTGHNANGTSIVVRDSTIKPETILTDMKFAVLWETFQFPASNEGFEDPILNRTATLANSKGVVFRVVDFAPASQAMMHRTSSLDFGILVEGEITCELDDGQTIDMKPGDVCVQRGTMHGWTNRSDQPARMYFVLTAADPVKVGTTILNETGFKQSEMASGGQRQQID